MSVDEALSLKPHFTDFHKAFRALAAFASAGKVQVAQATHATPHRPDHGGSRYINVSAKCRQHGTFNSHYLV